MRSSHRLMSPGARPSSTRAATPVRAHVAGAVLGALVLGVTACSSSDSVRDRARDGSAAGYVTGDGTLETVPVARRAEPVQLEGALLDGSPWSLKQAADKVVVVNLWASNCPPCEAEAPHLKAAATTLLTRGDVAFIGVDAGESAATGAAAQARLGLPYPSLSDEDRAVGAALQNKTSYPPTTLVLDRRGRIAARFSGPLTSANTLTALVDEVAAERM